MLANASGSAALPGSEPRDREMVASVIWWTARSARGQVKTKGRRYRLATVVAARAKTIRLLQKTNAEPRGDGLARRARQMTWVMPANVAAAAKAANENRYQRVNSRTSGSSKGYSRSAPSSQVRSCRAVFAG